MFLGHSQVTINSTSSCAPLEQKFWLQISACTITARLRTDQHMPYVTETIQQQKRCAHLTVLTTPISGINIWCRLPLDTAHTHDVCNGTSLHIVLVTSCWNPKGSCKPADPTGLTALDIVACVLPEPRLLYIRYRVAVSACICTCKVDGENGN